jgi:hypothetical protein
MKPNPIVWFEIYVLRGGDRHRRQLHRPAFDAVIEKKPALHDHPSRLP